jgi:hypothetical protein
MYIIGCLVSVCSQSKVNSYCSLAYPDILNTSTFIFRTYKILGFEQVSANPSLTLINFSHHHAVLH